MEREGHRINVKEMLPLPSSCAHVRVDVVEDIEQFNILYAQLEKDWANMKMRQHEKAVEIVQQFPVSPE